MKKTLLCATIAALSIGVTTSAIAKGGWEGKNHKGKMFEKMDANSDGTITKAEYVAHAEQRFTKMDANNDGNLTKEEIKAHHEKMKEEYKNKKKDRNNDNNDGGE